LQQLQCALGWAGGPADRQKARSWGNAVLTCRDVTQKASRYLDEDLPRRERAAVRMHLVTCDGCARYIGQMSSVVQLLPHAVEQPLDDAALEQTMARIATALPTAAIATSSANAHAANAYTANARKTEAKPAGSRNLFHRFGQAVAMGAAGLAAWELVARNVIPICMGFSLDPRTLIDAALNVRGTGGDFIHLSTGVLVFPLVFLTVVQPLARRVAPRLPWWGVGAAFGVGLWVVAGTIIANGLGGMPLFFGFGAVAFASLVGHATLGIATAAAAASLQRAPA